MKKIRICSVDEDGRYGGPQSRMLEIEKYLNKNKELLSGYILDVGGKKNKFYFEQINSNKIISWKFVNNNENTKPDFLCDASNIPLNDNTVDQILCIELLEYVKDPNKVINEFYRLLKKDSYLILSCPFNHPIHGDYEIDRARFTSVFLEELLTEAKFKIISLESMGSVGAVLYDTLWANFSYANKNKRSSIGSYILPFFKFLFQIIDIFYNEKKKYINTGYFVIAVKK